MCLKTATTVAYTIATVLSPMLVNYCPKWASKIVAIVVRLITSINWLFVQDAKHCLAIAIATLCATRKTLFPSANLTFAPFAEPVWLAWDQSIIPNNELLSVLVLLTPGQVPIWPTRTLVLLARTVIWTHRLVFETTSPTTFHARWSTLRTPTEFPAMCPVVLCFTLASTALH